jgi:hypothetical protein
MANPMAPIGDKVYAAVIPSQPDDTHVAYYIQAEDDRGASVTDPPRAPADVHHILIEYQPLPLFINEFMADNETTLEDPDEPGEFPDWIELYNPGPTPIHLSGKYLSDDLADPTKFSINANLTIPAGGFILFYADSDPEQGLFHTNFKLSKNGGSIGLFDSNVMDNYPIDTYTFGSQIADVAERRYPNGGHHWMMVRTPTPGWGDIMTIYLPVVLKRTMHY